MLVKDGRMLIEGSFCQGPNHIRVDVDKNVVKTEAFQVWPARELWCHLYVGNVIRKIKRGFETRLSLGCYQ